MATIRQRTIKVSIQTSSTSSSNNAPVVKTINSASKANQNENKQTDKKHNENVIQTILQWEKKNNSVKCDAKLPHAEQPMKLIACNAAE